MQPRGGSGGSGITSRFDTVVSHESVLLHVINKEVSMSYYCYRPLAVHSPTSAYSPMQLLGAGHVLRSIIRYQADAPT